MIFPEQYLRSSNKTRSTSQNTSKYQLPVHCIDTNLQYNQKIKNNETGWKGKAETPQNFKCSLDIICWYKFSLPCKIPPFLVEHLNFTVIIIIGGQLMH